MTQKQMTEEERARMSRQEKGRMVVSVTDEILRNVVARTASEESLLESDPTEKLQSFLDKAVEYAHIRQLPLDEPVPEEETEISSSDSSTVISESTPHWVDYFEPDPWADHLKPSLQLTEYDRFSLEEEEEKEEILSDRSIIEGLSFPSPCPLIYNYSLNKLQLPGKDLHDIQKIENYKYLQYVDLSHNKLNNLTPLENLPFLMHLDVSHNKLTSVLAFKAPLNLTYVNFSHNFVSYIDDLTDFWSLIKLNLSSNCISKIEGLQNLRYLRVLDLSANLIRRFENLSFLRITHLFLQNNRISEFEEGREIGMKTLKCIYYVNLDGNELKSLALFKDAISIQKISMVGNQIGEVFEMENLKKSVNLKELNLLRNPVIEWPEYRGMVIGTVPSLCILDGTSVLSEEKVKSKNTFDPDIRLVAARNHSLLLIMEQLNNPNIEPYIFPVDEKPLPLVILVGPVASMKGHLARRISKRFENKVCVGVSHTSRSPKENEVHGYHYYFVSKDKINELALNGAFLAFTEILGESYGFARMELKNAFEKQCLCITCMDLVGATAMYDSGLQPYLVLAISKSEKIHKQRLLAKPFIKRSHRGDGLPIAEPMRTKEMVELKESIFTDSFFNNIVQNKEDYTADQTSPDTDPKARTAGDNMKEAVFTDSYIDVITGDSPRPKPIETYMDLKKAIFTDSYMDSITATKPDDNSRAAIAGIKKAVFTDSYMDMITGDKPRPEPLATHINVKKAIFTDSLLDCIVEKEPYRHVLEREQAIQEQSAYMAMCTRLMLQSREDYFKIYAQKKEFFSSVIYTDNMEDAYTKLIKIVKQAYRSGSESTPLFQKETDMFKKSIPERLKYYMTEINKHHQVYEQEKSSAIQQDSMNLER